MGFVICVMVMASVLFIKLKYRPRGNDAQKLFSICIIAGISVLLAVGSITSLAGVLYYAADIAICSAIVLTYRYEARRQAVVREKKQRERKIAAIMKKRTDEQAAQRRPLSCFAAFTEQTSEAA